MATQSILLIVLMLLLLGASLEWGEEDDQGTEDLGVDPCQASPFC